MSVIMSLYRIIPNVTYIPTIFDRQKRSDYDDQGGTIDWLRLPVWYKEAECGAPFPSEEALDPTNHEAYTAWCDEYDKWVHSISCWSDGGHYDRYNLFLNKEDMRYEEYKALRDKYKAGIVNTGFGWAELNIPVEEVEYAQGWFFRKKFFNRKNTCFSTTSKERMIKVLYSNLKYKDDEVVQDVIHRFINAWKDGMIFECAW